MLFDSHAHINNESYSEEQRSAVIETIEKAEKLEYVMDVGFDLESSAQSVKHAKQLPWCYATVGVHPHNAKDMDEMQLALIKGLAKKDKVQAIGEIGLDFHYNNSEPEAQRHWFREQIRLANELKMPMVIHSRDADQEVMDILKEEQAFSKERKSWFPKRSDGSDDARVLLHCFSGSSELGKQYVKLGAALSIAGPVTYKSARKTVGVVEAVPLAFLLVETDAPYLTPEPFRGKKNISPYVEYTAKKLAEIKGVSFEEVAKQTNINARRFFDID